MSDHQLQYEEDYHVHLTTDMPRVFFSMSGNVNVVLFTTASSWGAPHWYVAYVGLLSTHRQLYDQKNILDIAHNGKPVKKYVWAEKSCSFW